MDGDHQDESHAGGQQGGEEEVGDGAEGDHSAHLGVEAGGACDQACNHKWENHQLEKPHEELARVGDDVDGEERELIVSETESSEYSYAKSFIAELITGSISVIITYEH